MKKLLSLVLLLAAPAFCFGQGVGAGNLKAIELFAGKSVATTTAAGTTTNLVTDNHGNNGLAMVVWTWTNTVSTVGSPSIGLSILGCATDSGTFAPLTLSGTCVSNASVIITNFITGSKGTNVTFTLPTSFSGAASNSLAGAFGTSVMMFPAGSVPRYLSARIDVPTGTNTYIVSATLLVDPAN